MLTTLICCAHRFLSKSLVGKVTELGLLARSLYAAVFLPLIKFVLPVQGGASIASLRIEGLGLEVLRWSASSSTLGDGRLLRWCPRVLIV